MELARSQGPAPARGKRAPPHAPTDTPAPAQLEVAVVGGGLGGLAVCLALQQAGVACTVYERDAEFADRRQGYGLTLTNNPKGPLARLGLLDECVARDCPSMWHWVFDRAGHVLGYFGRGFLPASAALRRSQTRGNLRIPRQDLRQMLLDRLAPGSVQWGRSLVGYSEGPEHVDLEFADSTSARATVVVGADGVRSVVRHLRDARLGQEDVAPLSYLGVAVILGLSALAHPLIDEGGFYMLDGTHRLFTMPFSRPGEGEGGGGEGKARLTMWQLSFSGLSEEAAAALRREAPEVLLEEALRRTALAFEPVQALVRATPLGEVWATGLYDRDPLPPLRREQGTRVTLLGDAAHPMSMFKGQGANQALCDAPLLASWLTRPGRLTGDALKTRLRCYEREMAARTGPRQLASREAAARLHSPAVLNSGFGGDSEPFKFDGVDAARVAPLLAELRARHVGAALGQALQPAVAAVVAEEPLK